MLAIKVGKKRLKIFNLLILILVLILFLYLISNLIFMFPFFKSNYKYKVNNGNYKTEMLVTFKSKWFNCYVTESVKIDSEQDIVFYSYVNDLLNDGYKKVSKNTYKKTFKTNGFCKQTRKEYIKEHDIKYALFSLNGNYSEIIEYGNSYIDSYVTSKINNKDVKEVDVSTNYNENKIGTYVTSYSLLVSKYYKKRLYRIISVVDKVKPEITLLGDDIVTLDYGRRYVEPGFSAIDNYDGDITSKVKVKNTIDTKKPGTYKITYSVTDTNGNKSKVYRNVVIKEKNSAVSKTEPIIEQKDGITYVNGIIFVNKDYSLPEDYDPKVNKKAYKALEKMQNDAMVLGLDLNLISGYRSYETQEKLFQKYALKDGEEKANTYSAKPGHSEHQTGLAFDIGSVDRTFENTDEAKWIEENAHLYGFIVRYPKNKTDITGYIYEPWHVRYLGVDVATKVKASGLTLEEYLGIN